MTNANIPDPQFSGADVPSIEPQRVDKGAWQDHAESCQPKLATHVPPSRMLVEATEVLLNILREHDASVSFPCENSQLTAMEPEAARTVVRALMGVTADIFGSAVTVFEDHDPEYPDDKYVVVAVETSLPPQAIVDGERRWIMALRQIAPSEFNSIRLLINAR